MNSVAKQKKKVLIISYYFPPLGMGGVLRVSKFVKYLSSFGWEPVVLTVKGIEYFTQDPSLLDELPKGVKIYRTGSFDPLRLMFILKRLFRRAKGGCERVALRIQKNKKGEWLGSSLLKLINFFSFPDNKIGWLPFALTKVIKLCRQEKIDLLFSTSPPLTCHLVGFFLKKITGLKWVTDYRDPYLTYEDNKSYPFIKKLYLKNLQKPILKNADGIVTVNKAISEGLKKISPEVEDTEVITNGYDQEDFEIKVIKNEDVFRIVYFGTFSPDCPVEPFLKALHNLIQQHKIHKDKIRFSHVGLSIGIDLERLVEEYELKETTELKGYLTHQEGVKELLKADLALLTVAESSPVITTGKIFEYFGAKKPILSIVPSEGEAAKLIQSLGVGKVVSPENISEIEDAILSFYKESESESPFLETYSEEVKKYEKKYLTSKLAQLLDKVTKK